MSCAAYLFQLPFLGSAMVFMILYTWSRKNPDSPARWVLFRRRHRRRAVVYVSFSALSMFGFQLQAFYLPWALVGFHLLIGTLGLGGG
jgi:hypothetical protein